MRALALLLAISALLPAQQYVIHAYRQADGLKNLAVRSLATGCDGYLWLATENGVFRFLGSSFEHFGREQGIAELGIQEIVADSSCTVWAGTTQNLYRFNGERFLPAAHDPIRILNPHGMAALDSRHLLVVDKGRLYRLEHAADGQMLSYQAALPAAALQSFPKMGQATSVSVVSEPSSAHRIWIGAGSKLYSWAEPASITTQPGSLAVTEWGKQQGLPDDHWESVVVDHSGAVWAEGWSHIAALPAHAARFADHSIPVSAQGSYFLRSRLVVDNDGRVLAPTDAGIARWQQDHWQIIDRNSGLPRNNQIAAMVFDAAGDLWLGSYGDGLYNWSGYRQWEGYADDKRLPSLIIWAIDSSHPDRVIVGTDKGPAWIDPASGQSGPLLKSGKWTAGLIVAMRREHDGSLWAATNSGSVLRIDDRTGQTTQTAHLPVSILSGFEDAGGRLFLGTDHGIYLREPGAANTQPHPVPAANALIDDFTWINAGCQAPNGADWFLAGNRLLREQNGQWSKPSIDSLPGPERGRLIALSCAPNGALWVTGQHIGAWRLTPAGDHLHAWRLDPPAELRGIESYAVLADRRGDLWLGTDQGLLAWNGSVWRHLTQESGMIWNDVDEWSLNESPDGTLWAGTSGGLAHLFHPERIFNPVALPVSITGVERGTDTYPLTEQISLPWSPLPLRFQLSSPLALNRSELVFKYQIEGLHSGWIESRDGQAILSAIPPGDYTFLATAANPGLNANSAIVKLRLLIRPPWWRKTWFLALSALVLLLLLAVCARIYARHLRTRSRQLEALVRQRTKELEDSREQLRIQATFDELTGMLNRSAILAQFAQQMESARRKGKPLILALTDVDHFKNVNDAYGHLAGDEALRRFAAALRVAIRAYDNVGRYGGEEFLLILTDIPADLAEIRLLHLHAAVSNLRVRAGSTEIRITCSIGATVFDPLAGPQDAEALLAIADQALYAAKAAGRNRVVFTPAHAHPIGQTGLPDSTAQPAVPPN
jgi:diguanylate cyclase (GGDEF)-like protein